MKTRAESQRQAAHTEPQKACGEKRAAPRDGGPSQGCSEPIVKKLKTIPEINQAVEGASPD